MTVLPVELFHLIIQEVANDRAIYRSLASLKSCRKTCRTLNDLVLPHLYNHIPLNGPHAFAKFLDELRENPYRGSLVRILDFSAFTSVGLGRSRSCNTKINLLTATTLNECLMLCPNLEEVLLSEALEFDIDANVLRTLFCSLKHLRALDFCASDCVEFVDAFAQFMHEESQWSSKIANLSLHNCSTLPYEFFLSFLPHFTSLRRLDLYNTQVTGAALFGIQESCRLEVLNLSQCTLIYGEDLFKFISRHPAAQTIINLSLLYSWNKSHPFTHDSRLLHTFLRCLPRDMEVLDIAGVNVNLDHLALMPSTLRELGVHDIYDIDIETRGDLRAMLPHLQYLLLTQHIISRETRYAHVLTEIFPALSIIESPGFARLSYACSRSYVKISGYGRRDWLARRGMSSTGIESSGGQWHPRKSNMSVSHALPRGIYDYYSYRV